MRNKILIVDDEALNRDILKQIFEGSHEILMACDGEEAMEQFRRYRDELAAVLLDLIMPKVNGYQVLQALNAGGETKRIPIILITANTDIKVALSCYSIGAAEIVNKPFVAGIVRHRVMNIIEMYESREQLKDKLHLSEQKLHENERQLEEFNRNLIDTISDVVEFRDMESGEHIKRMKGFTQILGTAYEKLYPDSGLTPHKIDMIVQASVLHDIGKIAIPDSILLKPAKLTENEMEVMKSHTTKGCDILEKLENVQDAEHYTVAHEIVRHHHERYDGNGYPDGLKGDEIPLSAMLVSVADVYDALRSDRVYKKAYDSEKAYQMIVNGECGVFHPNLMKCLEYSRKAMEFFADSI